jgi:site-specific DNA-cytosine methylase
MPKLRTLDLFSGAGGFTLGLQRFATPVAYCDNDKEVVEVLEKRMTDGRLPKAPIFGDISKLKASHIPGPVDLVTAGFPCPDVSLIGKKSGIDGGMRTVLVYHALRLVRELDPSYVFLENVPAIASDKDFGVLLKKISNLGYDWAYDFFTASKEGASHRRDRWLLLAVRRTPEPVPVVPSCPSSLRSNLKLRGLGVCDKRDPKCAEGLRFYKLYGNALVPAVACTAFTELHSRLMSDNTPGELLLRGERPDWKTSAVVSEDGKFFVQPRRDKGECGGRSFTIRPRKSYGRTLRNNQPLVTKSFTRQCLPTPRTGVGSGAITKRTKGDLGPLVLASSLCPRHLRHSSTARIDVGFLENLMGFPRSWSR